MVTIIPSISPHCNQLIRDQPRVRTTLLSDESRVRCAKHKEAILFCGSGVGSVEVLNSHLTSRVTSDMMNTPGWSPTPCKYAG